MKTIQEIKTDLETAIAEIPAIQGLNTSDRVNIAIALLREYGKYNRGEAMSTGRNSNNRDMPATDKQKNALSKFGIKFLEDISKGDASDLLDKAITESKNRKGGFSARSFK
jgi:hypothetical protein